MKVITNVESDGHLHQLSYTTNVETPSLSTLTKIKKKVKYK